MSNRRSQSSPRQRWQLPLRAWWVLAPLAILPIAFAVLQLGRWHPDEVFQFLEPANFRARGYGDLAWEWEVGLRNWAVPLLFSWIIRAADAVGIAHPQVIRGLVALPQLALQLAAMVATYRYAERRLDRTRILPVLLASALVGLFAPMILFAGRTMGESLSATLLVLAFERLERDEEPRRDGLIGGLWLGLSVVVRYGSAVFVLAALAWLLWTRRLRVLRFAIAGGSVVALALGALDWATWGRPFHSLWEYTRFNVISGAAAERFGSAPWHFYLPLFLLWNALWVWPGLVRAFAREQRVPLPAFGSLVYIAMISATAHKEPRFLYPAWILMALAAAPHTVALIQRVKSTEVRGALVPLALASGCFGFVVFTPDFRGDEFRALVKAGRDPGTTGVVVVNQERVSTGGSFYLGRDIPWYATLFPARAAEIASRDPQVNRAIACDGVGISELERVGFRVVDHVGQQAILIRDARPGRDTYGSAPGI